jgi:hypothetical protein
VPGTKAKKTIAMSIVNLLLSGKVSTGTINEIMAEIKAAGYTSSSVQDVLQDHKNGLVGDETASEARGYAKGEVEKAKKDRAERAAATILAQTSPGEPPKNPASRGVPSLDSDVSRSKGKRRWLITEQ